MTTQELLCELQNLEYYIPIREKIKYVHKAYKLIRLTYRANVDIDKIIEDSEQTEKNLRKKVS